MDFGFEGKVAAVAASSSGLGLATARAFAREGAQVAICGRSRERLEAAAASLGPGAFALELDLLAPGACERFVDETAARFGRLDVLVTNSGGPPPGDVLDFDDEAYRAAFEGNALVHIRLARAALPHLRAHGDGGAILAITSAAVKQPIDGLGLSNTARSGLTGYLKTLSNRIAAENISVNSVAPGLHDTERLRALSGGAAIGLDDVPAGRLGAPDDFGAVVCFLASPPARYITGQTIVVDGGRSKALL